MLAGIGSVGGPEGTRMGGFGESGTMEGEYGKLSMVIPPPIQLARLRARLRKKRKTIRPMSARPPSTPPMMPPIIALLLLVLGNGSFKLL